jgi:hypothetical protein
METYQDAEPGYKKVDDLHMQNWVFNYNPYTQQWAAIPRSEYRSYWSDFNMKGVYKSRNINTLIEVLLKTKGNPEEMTKLIKKA